MLPSAHPLVKFPPQWSADFFHGLDVEELLDDLGGWQVDHSALAFGGDAQVTAVAQEFHVGS